MARNSAVAPEQGRPGAAPAGASRWDLTDCESICHATVAPLCTAVIPGQELLRTTPDGDRFLARSRFLCGGEEAGRLDPVGGRSGEGLIRWSGVGRRAPVVGGRGGAIRWRMEEDLRSWEVG